MIFDPYTATCIKKFETILTDFSLMKPHYQGAEQRYHRDDSVRLEREVSHRLLEPASSSVIDIFMAKKKLSNIFFEAAVLARRELAENKANKAKYVVLLDKLSIARTILGDAVETLVFGPFISGFGSTHVRGMSRYTYRRDEMYPCVDEERFTQLIQIILRSFVTNDPQISNEDVISLYDNILLTSSTKDNEVLHDYVAQFFSGKDISSTVNKEDVIEILTLMSESYQPFREQLISNLFTTLSLYFADFIKQFDTLIPEAEDTTRETQYEHFSAFIFDLITPLEEEKIEFLAENGNKAALFGYLDLFAQTNKKLLNRLVFIAETLRSHPCINEMLQTSEPKLSGVDLLKIQLLKFLDSIQCSLIQGLGNDEEIEILRVGLDSGDIKIERGPDFDAKILYDFPANVSLLALALDKSGAQRYSNRSKLPPITVFPYFKELLTKAVCEKTRERKDDTLVEKRAAQNKADEQRYTFFFSHERREMFSDYWSSGPQRAVKCINK